MDLACEAAGERNGAKPSPKQIWTSLRGKDISRSIRYFLWMLAHDGYKVGRHWLKISGFEQRGTCQHCETTESMEHILTKCESPGQEMVWDLASQLWETKTGSPLRPTVGEIIACNIIKVKRANGSTDLGATRLRTIVVSESAHLLWKIRNDRVINGREVSNREIRNRWICAINSRLALDCALTDRKKYDSKALNKSIVLQTWRKVLWKEDELPKDWIREDGVLVGIRP